MKTAPTVLLVHRNEKILTITERLIKGELPDAVVLQVSTLEAANRLLEERKAFDVIAISALASACPLNLYFGVSVLSNEQILALPEQYIAHLNKVCVLVSQLLRLNPGRPIFAFSACSDAQEKLMAAGCTRRIDPPDSIAEAITLFLMANRISQPPPSSGGTHGALVSSHQA